MNTKSTARFLLRDATAGDHDRVDAAFAQFTLTDHSHYRAFLRAQADVFLPIETAIDRFDLSAILPDWPARRRSAVLVADLEDLGDVVTPFSDVPTYASVKANCG